MTCICILSLLYVTIYTIVVIEKCYVVINLFNLN